MTPPRPLVPGPPPIESPQPGQPTLDLLDHHEPTWTDDLWWASTVALLTFVLVLAVLAAVVPRP